MEFLQLFLRKLWRFWLLLVGFEEAVEILAPAVETEAQIVDLVMPPIISKLVEP